MTDLRNTRHSCFCIGPQNGEPLCPCMMRERKVAIKNGRYVEPEKDLGPVKHGASATNIRAMVRGWAND